MKHFKQFLLVLLVALTSSMTATPQDSNYDFEVDGLFFSILSEEETTCGLAYVPTSIFISNAPSVYSGDVIIPETVEHDGKTYTVTEILSAAFWCCENLTSVTIPNTIVKIGYAAFGGSKGLTNIVVPNSVDTIENRAFMGCPSLETVVLPDNLTCLGMSIWKDHGSVFSNCPSLKSINIPTSLTILYDKTFENCTSLTEIEIPASVTEIGANPFAYCSALEKICCPGNENFYFENDMLLSRDGRLITALDHSTITVPETVKKIDYGAFTICKSLTAVNIPDGVTEIGDYAFNGCEKLESVVLPNSITELGGSAFSGCTSLKSAVLPNALAIISSSLFSGCTSLTDVEIPSTVTGIGGESFRNCISLRKITIPASVTSLGNPFGGCSDIDITVEGDNFSLENNCLIGTIWCGKSVLCALNKEKISIPESVECINYYAFTDCDKLETVDFPASLTRMYIPFVACPNLKSIYLYGPAEFSQEYFGFSKSDVHPDCKIYVPKLHLEEYKEKYPYYADMFEPFDSYLVGDNLTDDNGIVYTITSAEEGNKTCSVTTFKNLEEINIPESIDGFSVTAIANRISPRYNTTKVVLPKTIKSMCDKALQLNKLTEAYIYAESMDEYGSEVFKISNSLKIYVPAGSVETYKAAWPEAADNIFPMEETAINMLFEETSHSKTLNLQGQPVSDSYKGIVIKDGKKYIAK